MPWRSISHLLCGLALCMPPAANAANWLWTPRVQLSSRHFEYIAGESQVQGELFSLGVGMTAIYDRFYLDVNTERNLEPGEETSSAQLIPQSITELVEFDRQDSALTIGYGVSQLTSVFAGYKQGKTTITAVGNSPFAGNALSLSGAGPFIGAGAGWQVKDWGIASFSAGYAALHAEYNAPGEQMSGRASGTSLSFNWRGTLGKGWEYQTAVTRHDYRYKRFAQRNGEISENIFSYFLGLAYRF